MAQAIDRTNTTLARLAETIQRLLQRDPLFQKLNTVEQTRQIAAKIEADYAPDEWAAIADSELEEMVDFALALETISGTLNELSPEQIEQFDAAVSGR